MASFPYVACFFGGLLVGLYIGNLKFRTQTNAFLKKVQKKMAKADMSKGFK